MACLGHRVAAVSQASHAHHVAPLLVIRVGVEQVVGHVFEHGLDGLARHLSHRGVRISGGGHVEQPLTRDGLARQQRGAPAEARGERNVCALHVQQRVDQQLITRAVEVATAVQQTVGHGQLF